MKLQTFMKKNIKYMFLFIFFFLCLQFFYTNFSGDQLYNYGFSYAISRGEIPYKDFNMIVPPMGTFVYAIPFLLFGHSLVVFNLFQALLLCVMFYFLFKLFGKNAWVALIVLFLPMPVPSAILLFQGYNFLLILEFIILIYLEKNKKSDYLVGIVLALAIFSKQTVGFLLCIPSFIYLFKDHKRFFKRMMAVLLIVSSFLIYLLITGSFMSFFDMCLFGMFDFASKNGGFNKYLLDFYFYVFVLEFVFLLFYLWKNRNNKETFIIALYTLMFSSIAIPLLDYNHVSHFTFILSLLFIDKINIRCKNIGVNALLFVSATSVMWFLFTWEFNLPNMINFNNYGFTVMSSETIAEIDEVTNFMRKNKNTILLSDNTYLIKIILDYDIEYYDLLNYGNHGYNGTEKLIQRLESEKNKYILINMDAYEKKYVRKQFNEDVVDYVIKNYDKVDSLDGYDVYYKE